MNIDLNNLSELAKYFLPAIGVFFTLLIPKVWDWWRESSKNRYENRKIIKTSLYHLLNVYTVLSETEFYLRFKGCKVDYGIYISVGGMPEKEKADAFISGIMKFYRDSLVTIRKDLNTTCVQLSTVEPVIANEIRNISIDNFDDTHGMKKYFNLPFSPERALNDVVIQRDLIEFYCHKLASLLNSETKKLTDLQLKYLKEKNDDEIKKMENNKKELDIKNLVIEDKDSNGSFEK